MEQQHRRKRAKATPAELPETSSSRAPNGELRTLLHAYAPLILSDADQRVLQNDDPVELGSLPHSNPNISTPSLEPGVNEDGESLQLPDMGSNMHSRAPAGAAPHDQDEAILDGEAGTDTLLQRDFSTGAEEEHGEASTEPVSIEEIFIETSLSPHVSTSLGITEGPRLCADEKTIRNNLNPPNSPSMAEEEAHGDKADGMNCPICMEPWTGEGIHRICCLACGHLFGRSCIRRWLNQRGKKNSKCPHCNRKARIEDIRNLYVPSLTVVDDKNQQLLEELGVLKSKNEELVVQNEKLRKDYQNLQAVLAGSHLQDTSRSKENFFTKRSLHPLQGCSRRESYIVENQTRRHNFVKAYGMDTNKLQKAITVNDNKFPGQFQLQEEFSLLGARVFDMDAYSQMLLVAQKSTAVNGAFFLNKISLLSLADALMMPLPPCTGAVRDIRVAPPGGKLPGRLALVASLGKMISLFSLESNNVVLTYKLQSPCWSCAWDPNEPNYVFAGLQDGGITIFDLRQTSSPLRSLQSFRRQPVHTLHPINECNLPQGIKRNGVLSACSNGVCFWDLSTLDLHDSRHHAITCSNNSGICVALAYNHLANAAVTTFRDKPSAYQPGAMSHTADVAVTEPSIISNTQLNLGFHPLRASHYPLARSVSTSPLGPECQIGYSELRCEDVSSMNCGWKYGNPMFGNVSPVGMHRSAISFSSCIERSSGFQSVFAFGDEESRALMLWDVKTLTVMDRLKAHCSPILDVKSMNIGEHSILGCISSTNLQVYKR